MLHCVSMALRERLPTYYIYCTYDNTMHYYREHTFYGSRFLISHLLDWFTKIELFDSVPNY